MTKFSCIFCELEPSVLDTRNLKEERFYRIDWNLIGKDTSTCKRCKIQIKAYHRGRRSLVK